MWNKRLLIRFESIPHLRFWQVEVAAKEGYLVAVPNTLPDIEWTFHKAMSLKVIPRISLLQDPPPYKNHPPISISMFKFPLKLHHLCLSLHNSLRSTRFQCTLTSQASLSTRPVCVRFRCTLHQTVTAWSPRLKIFVCTSISLWRFYPLPRSILDQWVYCISVFNVPGFLGHSEYAQGAVDLQSQDLIWAISSKFPAIDFDIHWITIHSLLRRCMMDKVGYQ